MSFLARPWFFSRGRIVLWFRRIVSRIARRHLCADFLAPGMQSDAQFVGLPWHGGRQVALLTDVFPQIVKLHAHVIEELDQLEVAGTNRAVGRGAPQLVVLVMRVMPEQRIAVQLAFLA